jgi:hypothetical protein
MAVQGPIVVLSDGHARGLTEHLASAGAFPVLDVSLAEAPVALPTIEPAAILVVPSSGAADAATFAEVDAYVGAAETYVPVLAHDARPEKIGLPLAIPFADDVETTQIIARLKCALRVRSLQASVARRQRALELEEWPRPASVLADSLSDATVLMAGRGRSYPDLTIALGERVGLIGALSLVHAARFLEARDVDGIVVCDGFSRRAVESFVEDLASDPRFRELPVIVTEDVHQTWDPEQLPMFEHAPVPTPELVARALPLVRQHAYAAALRRTLRSLDTDGVIDPETGLLHREAFMRDLATAIEDARDRGVNLSLARLQIHSPNDRRASYDAARIVGRLVRTTDFACRDSDGAILMAYTETDLRTAHVVARRIASVLKHTVLSPGTDRTGIVPSLTLATFRPTDTVASILARTESHDQARPSGTG